MCLSAISSSKKSSTRYPHARKYIGQQQRGSSGSRASASSILKLRDRTPHEDQYHQHKAPKFWQETARLSISPSFQNTSASPRCACLHTLRQLQDILPSRKGQHKSAFCLCMYTPEFKPAILLQGSEPEPAELASTVLSNTGGILISTAVGGDCRLLSQAG